MNSVWKGGWQALSATLLLFLPAGSPAPEPSARLLPPQDTSLEEFEERDPYTRGDPEAMRKAGYVSLGPFHWAGDHTTTELHETIGDIPVVFVETAHFRLASSLVTYKLQADREEKESLEREYSQLKKRLPRVKPGSSIDPWLRAHLYAQRLELIYSDFVERFGLAASKPGAHGEREPAAEIGPFLGQKDKFTVFLSQNRSAYGRYVRRYLGIEDEFSYRFAFPDSYFYGANFEAWKDQGRSLDIAFHGAVASAVVVNLVDAFRNNQQAAPLWFKLGLAHWYSRRVDPRFNQWGAGGSTNPEEDKGWQWEPRVHGLVKNDACKPWEAMLSWKAETELKSFEHMIVWSRVDYLLREKSASLRELLYAFTEPLGGSSEEREALLRERQKTTFAELWSKTPDEVDRDWRTWVLRNYSRN